jgi:hypothetical protein
MAERWSFLAEEEEDRIFLRRDLALRRKAVPETVIPVKTDAP